MKKYIINPSTCQALNPIGRELYLKFLANANKGKKIQERLTLAALTEKVFYALGSVANALQLLRIKGIIFFNEKTQSWMLVLSNHDSDDVYDAHVRFKRDWNDFVSMVKDNPISKYFRLEDRLKHVEKQREEEMGNRMNYNASRAMERNSRADETAANWFCYQKKAHDNTSLEEQLKKEQRKNQANRTSTYHSK